MASKVVCIIQARTGSTRLSNKVFMDLDGKPMLWRVVERVLEAKSVDTVIVATTVALKDRKIVEFIERMKNPKIRAFRGSEEDVLDRYYQVAKAAKADVIVRVTSDCPLIDPDVIDKVVANLAKGGYDYVSNVLSKRTYPRGFDVEAFTFNILEYMAKNCTASREREHVTTYIRENPDRFKTKSIEQENNLSHIRLTVDEEDDFTLVSTIYSTIAERGLPLNTEEILRLLEERPELLRINAHVEQKKSIMSDAN